MNRASIATAPLLLLVWGCHGEPAVEAPVSTAPPEEAKVPASEGPTSDDVAPEGTAPRGKVAACTTDASCNADPAISALWGACDVETGKCSCKEGATLDPISQRCSPASQP